MKTQIRLFFSLVLTIQLSFAPLASAKTDGVIEDLELATDLDDKTSALRAYVLQEYNTVESISDFVEIFADGSPKAEKEKIEEILSALTHFPDIEPIENGLRISVETLVYDIDMRNVKKKQFIINGVHFTLDPSLPLTTQSEILIKKLQVQGGNKGHYGKLFSMFLPEAQALGPLALLAPAAITFATTVASTVYKKAIDKYSGEGLNALDSFAKKKIGEAMKKKPKKKPIKKKKAKPVAKKRKTPKKPVAKTPKKSPLIAANVKDEAAEKEEVEVMEVKSTIQLSNEKCSKDFNAYNADLKVVENSKQSVVKIQGNYKNGKFREVDVYEDVPSLTSPSGTERKIIATYILDANSHLEEILIPGQKKSGADGATVPTLLRIENDGEETDESELETLNYHKNILNYVSTRATACTKAAASAPAAAAASQTKSFGSPNTTTQGAK